MHDTTADARFWDRNARGYAADPIKDLAGYERTIARTRELLRPTDTVLELGCGTGTTALQLAASVARFVASDVSPGMIAIAHERVAAHSCSNVEPVVAAAEAADWPDATFDVVLAFNVLHLLAGRETALTHLARVLKPGGLFISKTPCLSEMNPLIRLAVPVMRLLGKAPSVAFFTASALTRDIETAGFAIEETGRHGSGRKDARVFLVARKPEV